MSVISRLGKPPDGAMLMGSYGIYITQLIVVLEDDTSSWKNVICQVAVFFAIILSREYKKRNTDVVEASTQSEAPPSPRPPPPSREPNEPLNEAPPLSNEAVTDSLQTPNIQ